MTHALTDLDIDGQQRDIGTLIERSLGSWLKLHLEEAAPGFTLVCRDQACCVSSFSLSMTSSNLASGLRCSRRFAYFFQRGCRPYTCALMLTCHAMLCCADADSVSSPLMHPAHLTAPSDCQRCIGV